MEDFSKLLHESLKKISPKLNEMWLETAQSHGWDPKLYNQTSVKATPAGVHINYPSNIQQKVINEEFGFKSSPKAAIRNFDSSASKDIQKAAYDAVSQFLTDKKLI